MIEEAARAVAPPVDSPVPPEALTQLVATIDGFARTNRALVEELSVLRQSLTPSGGVPANGGVQAAPPAARPPQSALHAVQTAPVQVPAQAAAPQHAAPQQPGPAPAYQPAPSRA